MALHRETKRSDDVRAPAVPRGTTVIVTRYRENAPKVALVNPDDLAMLEASHELVEGLGELESSPVSGIALKALRAEDRPAAGKQVESAKKIAEILDL
jgi:hypothetical protein